MRLIIKILRVLFLPNIQMNLFGINRARQRKYIQKQIKPQIESARADTDKKFTKELGEESVKNPFESASAKFAMNRASKGAKTMQQRNLNAMGTGATAEAIAGMQGSINEGLGATAGQIAVGAEAQKNANIQNIKSRQDIAESENKSLQFKALDDIMNRQGKRIK